MRRLPPLAAIRAFEAAARTENFTAAAAELGMTQAAVSYQVKSLEERLGSPLFVREKGRVRLTPLWADRTGWTEEPSVGVERHRPLQLCPCIDPGSHRERSLSPLMDPRRGPPVRYVACKSAHYLRKPASSRPLVA